MVVAPNENKRIAVNTIVLYIRMLILMTVSLYTSRIVLEALGVVDFGLYNVVGGIVVALGFLSGTLNTASSRFITVSLSSGILKNMKVTFSNVLIVNIILALTILLVGETIGLWFIYNKINIPANRFHAAFWVYQMSIISVTVNIVTSAYNACIIAHEKMKAFAYISLIDALGKLLIAYMLLNIESSDKLIVYGGMLLLIQLIDCLIYVLYCARHFEETITKLKADKEKIMIIIKFLSWASYGSFVSIGFTQGLNILLNIFFGPSVNAARAVSVQVQNAVVSFTNNFQTAINPQLIKSVAIADFQKSQTLLKVSSKFSFFLLCLIGIPLIVLAPLILKLWLVKVPEHTVWFVRLMLIISIWSSIANPLRIINQAEGNIRKFQVLEGTALLMIVPVAYMALKFGARPEMVFLSHLFFELLSGCVRIKIVLPKIKMKISEYCKSVYIPLILIFGLSMLIGFIGEYIVNESILLSVVLLLVLEVSMLILMFFIGLTVNERIKIVSFINNRIKNVG